MQKTIHKRKGEIKICFVRDTPEKVSSNPLLFPCNHKQKNVSKIPDIVAFCDVP